MCRCSSTLTQVFCMRMVIIFAPRLALGVVLGIELVYAYWDLTFVLRDYLACMPYVVGSMH